VHYNLVTNSDLFWFITLRKNLKMSLSNSKKSTNLLLAIFICLTLLLCLGGYVLYCYQKKDITIEKHDELAAISKLKIDQIVNWRNERLEDARNISNNQTVIIHINEYIHGVDRYANYLIINKWLKTVLAEPDYSMALILDPWGKVIINTNPSKPITETGKHIIEQAKQHQEIIFSDLFRYDDKNICMDMAIPLYLNPEKCEGFSGVILLRIDPDKFLYPLIRSWPTPSLSSESMLVRRDGDSALFLSELQHKKNTALRLRKSMNDKRILAIQAVSGKAGILEGIDYRGIKVLGDAHAVPSSTWFVITKVDIDEIYHPIIVLAIWISIITILLILITALIIFLVWTGQLKKSERDRLALLQHFDYVVKYANDIICLADFNGDIYEVNDKAVNTYGYSYKEFLNLNLSQLQPPKTKDTIDQHYKLLNETNGYIYETIHINKNGKKFPVEVSGRIMTIQGVKYIQVIIRDITERKHAQEELTIYQQHLQELVDERTVDLEKLTVQLQHDIAERKLMEDKLRESEQRLRFHFENSPLAVVEWDADFIVTQWSKEAEHIFGWKTREIIGKPIGSLNMIFEEDIPIVNHTMERLTTGFETVVISSNRNITKEKTIIECIWYNTILKDEAGKMSSVMSLVEDITERKKAENDLRKLSSAVEQSPVSIVITDLEGNIEYGNPKVFEITGYKPSEILGKKPNLFKSGETPDETYKELWDAITSGNEWQGEFHNTKKNGELYWESASISPITDTKGKTINFLAIKEDITERKRAENELKKAKNELEIRVLERTEELAKSEERFRSTLDNLMEGCMFISHDWTYLYVNDSITEQMHKSRENLIGHAMMEIFPGVESMPVFEGYLVSMKERIQNQFVTDFKFPDGSVKWFDFHVEPVSEGIFVISSDKTERVLNEKALYAASLYHRNLLEASLDSLVTIGPDGKITDVNAATEKVTGYFREKLIGTDFSDYFTDPENALKGYQQMFKDGSVRDYPLEIQHPDGHATSVLYNASLYKDENGQVVGAFAAARDITERKKAEEIIKSMNAELEQRVVQRTIQLENANKELEAFSYSVSHDLRAPLRSIDGWSMALLEDCYDQLDVQGREYLERVRNETQRMGFLIDDLLKLSRVSRTELKKVNVDLTTLAKDITGRLLKTPTDRRFEFIIQPGMVTFGDPHMLDIALTNLLNNAYKFTGKQPVARIEFGQSIINEKQTYWVSDNGVGFDMSYSKNLFGAFQRFHKQSEFPGTGIGLATVQRIIHRHEGIIWAESTINQGTTFYFTLIEETL